MFIKLACKNVGKSFKDYAVYFFTLVLAVCIFYMFNSIYAQQTVMVVTESTHQAMESLTSMLSWISGFVSVVLGFLIIYANNFFVKRRKKELGIYMTLGMEKISISIILVLETSLLAIVALVSGLFMGVFLSQFMSLFTAKIFEADMTQFKFIFSYSAFLKSIMYFSIIFCVVILFNTVAISRFSLLDLIVGGRRNESLKIRSMKWSVAILVVAIISLGAAYYLIVTNGMLNINQYFLMSLILGTVGTLLFFFSFTSILILIIKKRKVLYYKDLNAFVLNQLSSKINTNFVSMSVVCIILLLTIGIFACGYSMQDLLSSDLRDNVPFEFSLYKDGATTESSIYDQLSGEIKGEGLIEAYVGFNQYHNNEMTYGKFGLEGIGNESYYRREKLVFVDLESYNAVMKLRGKSTLELALNQYGIVAGEGVLKDISDQFLDKNIAIELEGAKLHPKLEMLTDAMENRAFKVVFVVHKSFLKDMEIGMQVLNVNCTDEIAEKAYNKIISEYLMTNYSERAISYYQSKSMIYDNAISSKAIVSFIAIYLGLVFMITCAAILSIQQLTEAEDNKERYKLLAMIGADKRMLNKALFVQILCYFLLPLLLAIIHSVFGLIAANQVIMLFGNMDIVGTIVATSVFVVVIYGFYFVMTYIGSKNVVFKS